MNHKINVSKLASAEHQGDWHDKPLRWIVNGPFEEAQKFSTKAEATLYASCRRKSASFTEATLKFCAL